MNLAVQPVPVAQPPPPVNPAVSDDEFPYRLIKSLGGGAQGVAFLAHDKIRDEKVVLKCFMKGKENEGRHEATMLQKLRHTNIVEYYGTVTVPENIDLPPLPLETIDSYGENVPFSSLALVLKYAEDGDLLRVLVGADVYNQPFDAPSARHIFLQILLGLQRAHSLGVVLCDVKPDNILVDYDETGRMLIMLADLGMARDVPTTFIRGTEVYAAPEARMGKVKANNAFVVDVWSAAVCLAILVLGFSPFQKTEEDAAYWARLRAANEPPERMHVRALRKLKEAQQAGKSGVRAACKMYAMQARFDVLSADIAELLEGCLLWDPTQRFTLEQAVARSSTPWVAPPSITAPEIVAATAVQSATAAAAAAAAAATVPAGLPTQLQPSPARTRSWHEPADPQTAPAAVPTVSYRSMAAAPDEAEAPIPRGLSALGASEAELPRYTSCGALGASSGAHYRSAADMELPPPADDEMVFPVPKLKRENADL